MGTVIDWRLAQQIAGLVAADPQPPPARSFGRLPEVASQSERLVGDYTGLKAASPLPPPEALSRSQWIDANVGGLRSMLDPVVERMGRGMGPLAPPLQAAAGVVFAAEVGVLLGFMGRHVLGQYELVLLDAERPPRLLFVAPNLEDAIRSFDVDGDEVIKWVALHEVTHSLQFGGVPWLREHLAGLLRRLLATLEVSLDTRRLLRMPSVDDLRGLIESVRTGSLIEYVTNPEQRALMDRIQATMAVLEGHAEHVMDAVGAGLLPSLPRLRSALEQRRASRSAPARLLARLLGLELKLRQYELGKRFCDRVVEDAGVEALNQVWASPEALPSLPELESPGDWLKRTSVPIVTN
jgi:coenzyme F420 biosynthesis associated uncharacterized protein